MSLPAYGADATGFVRVASCDFLEGCHLSLVRFQKRNMEKTIVLPLPCALEIIGEDWLDVNGKECSMQGRCETVAKSRIQIMRVSHRWMRMRAVFGNFAVEFNDGRKLEGSFKAKEVRSSTLLICE
jgi:hypothetical protein